MLKHKNHYQLYLFLGLGIIFTSCSNKESTNEFILSGTYNGDTSSYVIFKYRDSAANVIEDTLEIVNKIFKAKGNLNNVSQGALYFEKIQLNRIESLPLACFFIEPGELFVTVNDGDSSNVSFKGSSIQDEFRDHEKKLTGIYNKLNTIVNERQQLTVKRSHGEADSNSIARLQELESKRVALLDSIKLIRLNYSSNHKDSQLGMFYLHRYFKDLEVDYVQKVYQNYDEDIKKGLFGKQLAEMISSRKSYGIGDQVPDFSAVDLKGNPLDLNSLKGQYFLLDFWASWCKPCLKNIPKLKTLQDTYDEKGFAIIGISIDRKEEAWRSIIEKEKLGDWQHYINNSNRLEDKVQNIFNFTNIPQYLLIDTKGIIIERYSSNLNELEIKLEELL